MIFCRPLQQIWTRCREAEAPGYSVLTEDKEIKKGKGRSGGRVIIGHVATRGASSLSRGLAVRARGQRSTAAKLKKGHGSGWSCWSLLIAACWPLHSLFIYLFNFKAEPQDMVKHDSTAASRTHKHTHTHSNGLKKLQP